MSANTTATKAKPSEPIEDYLDEDEPISSQKYALVSFLSPENVLDKKELFFFEKFLQNYEVEWRVKGMEAFLAERVNEINRGLDEKANAFDASGNTPVADMCLTSRIRVDTIMETYQEYIRAQQKDIHKTKITSAWEDFLFKNQAKLEEEFHAKNDFRTTIRGFKVRAVVRDEKEAEVRAKKLQKGDKYHNIFCAEVGKWTPWDPRPHLIADQEYAQEELNNLMRRYKENEDNKSAFFEEQRKTPGAKPAANKTLFGPSATTSTTTNTLVKVEDEGEGTILSAEAVTGVSAANVNALFGGVADLAHERRLKRQNSQADESTDE